MRRGAVGDAERGARTTRLFGTERPPNPRIAYATALGFRLVRKVQSGPQSRIPLDQVVPPNDVILLIFSVWLATQKHPITILASHEKNWTAFLKDV
jgi:hypothetical protein